MLIRVGRSFKFGFNLIPDPLSWQKEGRLFSFSEHILKHTRIRRRKKAVSGSSREDNNKGKPSVREVGCALWNRPFFLSVFFHLFTVQLGCASFSEY